MSKVDLNDTRIAFASKSNEELETMEFLFRLMSHAWLSKVGSTLGLKAVKWNLPFARKIVRKTIFRQFCGGRTLDEALPVISHLHKYGITTTLDYGAEGGEAESEFDKTAANLRASLEFAVSHEAVPYISSKITGLARTELLKKYQRDKNSLTEKEKAEFQRVRDRIDSICSAAKETDVAVMIDAEETNIQGTIDSLVEEMMEKYNHERVVIYHTFQLYRKDKLGYLKSLYEKSREANYLLGAKLVRGAYMEKERRWAREGGYPSPIHDTKEDTDRDYNRAVLYCIDRYREIALCNGSHNMKSAEIMVKRIDELGLPRNHPHLNFCQLYGMSDYITYNLAAEGYNVSKYVPYGPVSEVIPYLVRRAEENTAVTGEMGREYKMIKREIDRRKQAGQAD